MSNRSAKFVVGDLRQYFGGNQFRRRCAGCRQGSTKESAQNGGHAACRVQRGPFPAGGHWYYRDRSRHQAQLLVHRRREEQVRARRAEGFSSSPAASTPAASDSASPVAADPASPQQTINVRKSIANARAELTAPQARVEDLSEPQTTGAVPVASIANSQRAAAPDAARRPSSDRIALAGIFGRQPIERSAPCRGRATADSKPADSKPADQSTTRGAAARRHPGRAGGRGFIAGTDSRHRCRCCCWRWPVRWRWRASPQAWFSGSAARSAIAAGISRRPPRDLGFGPDRTDASPSMFPDEDTPIWRRNPPLPATFPAIRARPTIRSGG